MEIRVFLNFKKKNYFYIFVVKKKTWDLKMQFSWGTFEAGWREYKLLLTTFARAKIKNTSVERIESES